MNGGKLRSGHTALWAGYSIGKRPSILLSDNYSKYFSFGNPSQLPSPLKDDYGAFADHFVSAFAPEIFKTYLQQVQLFVAGQAWLSKKCQYLIFQFFTEWWVVSASRKVRDRFNDNPL